METPAEQGLDILTSLDGPLFHSLTDARSHVELCSPFLTWEPASRLSAIAAAGTAEWKFLTVLDPVAAAYGSLALDGVRNMIAAGIAVRHIPALHVKVFNVDDKIGFAGSANLTSAGLGAATHPNLEITVPLSSTQLVQASAVLADWWELATPVTTAMVDECQAEAAQVPVRFSRSAMPTGTSSDDVEIADALLASNSEAQVWIKAMDAYHGDDWINSSKRGRPSFRLGDLLVIYVKGTGACFAVVRVSGDTRNDPDSSSRTVERRTRPFAGHGSPPSRSCFTPRTAGEPPWPSWGCPAGRCRADIAGCR